MYSIYGTTLAKMTVVGAYTKINPKNFGPKYLYIESGFGKNQGGF